MAAPDYFKQSGEILATDQAKLQEQEAKLAECYSRWETLEN